MKKFVCIVFVFFLSGCGVVNRGIAQYIGHSKECVDGVEYIQFSSGASVAYTLEGKIKLCK
jgi:hypothetical protein